MARQRLNDTSSIRATPYGEGEELTIAVQKLATGGYLVKNSSYNPKTGQYKCDESFSEAEPRLSLDRTASGQDSAGSRGLADTMSYLSNKPKG